MAVGISGRAGFALVAPVSELAFVSMETNVSRATRRTLGIEIKSLVYDNLRLVKFVQSKSVPFEFHLFFFFRPANILIRFFTKNLL